MIEHILPVIDLKRGQVVHAIQGQRSQYQPLRSTLVNSFHPAKVAQALIEALPGNDLYVADLDAIQGEPLDWNSYSWIARTGARPWIDAGIGDPRVLAELLTKVANLGQAIIGLESLPSLRDLESLAVETASQKITFSLDLRGGNPVTSDPSAGRMSAESIATYVLGEGIQSLIVLEITAVGSQFVEDSTLDLCRKIRSRYPHIELISGGGVRSLQDVQRFVDAGCNRVLVATALHTGAITV